MLMSAKKKKNTTNTLKTTKMIKGPDYLQLDMIKILATMLNLSFNVCIVRKRRPLASRDDGGQLSVAVTR